MSQTKQASDEPKPIHKILTSIGIGLLISLPLIVVIISLLSSADHVFGYFADQMYFRLVTQMNIIDAIPHIIIVAIILLTLFSYMWSLQPREQAADKIVKANSGVDPIIMITILTLINIIYICFVWVQTNYLFIGAGLPEGFSYAQYARRGFFELIWVTLLNLSILLINMNFTRTDDTRCQRIVKILNTCLLICTAVILISAHLRMSMYEQAYGYTQLRLLTHTFMAFILGWMICTQIKIWWEKIPLFAAYLLVAVIAYTGINYANIDAYIAAKNVDRYHQTGKIDLEYLVQLSYDATPIIAELLEIPQLETGARSTLRQQQARLPVQEHWQSWNLAQMRAKEVFDKLLKE